MMSRNRKIFSAAADSSFPERFALSRLDDGGVLLDLATGSLYRLNAVATQICAALGRGASPAEAARELAESFGLTPAEARRDVRGVLAGLQASAGAGRPPAAETSAGARRQRRAPPPAPAPKPMTFEADDAGFLLRWHGEPVWRIDRHGRVLTRLPGATQPGLPPELPLQWVAPHLLALQHQPLLHASAVQWGDGVLAFSGESGAGKTTFAQLFAAEGHPRVSEDLILLSLDPGTPGVMVGGEDSLRRWVAARHEQLQRQVGRPTPASDELDVSDLADAVRGAARPLHAVMLLDRTRRVRSGGPGRSTHPTPPDVPGAARILTERLAPAEALVLLLRNSFGELRQPEIWCELLQMGHAIVTHVPVFSATVPDGLAALRAAVRAYSATLAS
jgi:Coenzyme PQQ synthesis protein D (PqqD)